MFCRHYESIFKIYDPEHYHPNILHRDQLTDEAHEMTMQIINNKNIHYKNMYCTIEHF